MWTRRHHDDGEFLIRLGYFIINLHVKDYCCICFVNIVEWMHMSLHLKILDMHIISKCYLDPKLFTFQNLPIVPDWNEERRFEKVEDLWRHWCRKYVSWVIIVILYVELKKKDL